MFCACLTKVNHSKFWWTLQCHNGKLWQLNNYCINIIAALGGRYLGTHIQGNILPNVRESLLGLKVSSFKKSMQYKKLTNSQCSGLNQIPNHCFMLWWSPTINLANVYISFQVQLNLTSMVYSCMARSLKIRSSEPIYGGKVSQFLAHNMSSL